MTDAFRSNIIETIIDYMVTNNPIIQITLPLLLLIGVPLHYFLKKGINYRFKHVYKKNNSVNNINVKALKKLYSPLYLYVHLITDINNYTPSQAMTFYNEISNIVAKHSLYSTDLLDDLLTKLHKELSEKKGNYRKTANHIRFYIITEYDRLRKSVGYPTTENRTRFLYTSSASERIAYIGVIYLFISILLFWIALYMGQNVSSQVQYLIVCVIACFFFAFSITTVFIFIFSGSVFIFNIIRNEKMKKIWSSYLQEDEQNKKEKGIIKKRNKKKS